MKKQILVGIIVTGLLSIIVSLLSGIISNLYYPSTTREAWLVIILFVTFIVISFFVTIYFQTDKNPSSKLTLFFRKYSSLWLVVIIIHIFIVISIAPNPNKFTIIASGLTILVSVIGYIRDLHDRKSSFTRYTNGITPKALNSIDELPSAYRRHTYEKK